MRRGEFEMENNDIIYANNKRLKKVKRPIKRVNPQGVNQPYRPQNSVANNENLNNDFPDHRALTAFDAEPSSENVQPHFITENELYPEPQKTPFLTKISENKTSVIIGIAAFVVGMIFAKIFFNQQTIVRDGLQGVVVNAEVPRGRARCGVAEKTQGCVLYIMNPQRQELVASDFYDLASQLTGRQRFIIETGNMRYSNRKIKPGEIAQFNIPPLQ